MNYKKIYKEAVNELDPSPELINRIKSGKEHKVVKFRRKRILIAAVIACMAFGTAALASGHITTLIGWSDPFSEKTDYNSVVKYIEDADLKVSIPEKLSNGYEFESSNTGRVKGTDDDGNTLAKGKTFHVTYKKAGCPDISLHMEPILESDDRSNASDIREINGVNVYYNEDTYKYVPADYQLTEEDERNMEDPHYFISYGADKNETCTMESISFEIDREVCNILCIDSEMNADEWFDLAKDFITDADDNGR